MKKVLLMVLDGFGVRDAESGNATKLSNMPVLNNIMSSYPVSELSSSGESVGLPEGTPGNSEVGHMTIGSGRVITQALKIIDDKIKDKSFFENDTLLSTMEVVNNNDSTLHIIGLLSNGLVHSSIDHFYAVVALAKIKKVKRVMFHFITDGRDTSVMSGRDFINGFMEKISKFDIGEVGTISGRYYAMDRDNNYDRVKKAYDAIMYNVGNSFSDYDRCMDLHYKNGITDEYINPSIITKNSVIKDNDAVIFINFRSDRMNELVDALVNDDFNAFQTRKLKNVRFVSLFTLHDKVEPAYAREPIYNSFGSYLSSIEFKQARIAETEKYRHVTYDFDAWEDIKDKNLYKILVPSAKVARYDMKPEMSSVDVSKAIMAAMNEDIDFILANYANPDVLGHTGNIPATVKGLEVLDFCIGKIIEKAEENYYDVIITSSHGNCEYMKDAEGNIVASHTTNDVPFVIVNSKYKLKNHGTLADVVPTIIDMFEISKPEDMTGNSLLIKEN